MAKEITALNRVLEFCKKHDIEIKILESKAVEEENTLLHIPGVKIIVSYKNNGSN